jgi:DNA-binding MarR family transcriptional regulator
MPERLDPPPEEDLAARAIGLDVAGMIRYQMAVLDREDRLESGTGAWREAFIGDAEKRSEAANASVLRSIAMAVTSGYHEILDALYDTGHLKMPDIAARLGISELTVQERVSDLVSAGLANKVPEANQAAITPSGAAIVTLTRGATSIAARDLSNVE